jgi:hypothetical protein
MATDERQQASLPFGEAEGSFAEREELLGLALLKVKADLHLAQLTRWIFSSTHGGIEGTLRKTYEQLGAAPWGLCCGRSKVAETVSRARRLGLIEVTETRERFGDRGPNEYSIDWCGVRAILGRITIADASAPRTTPSAPRTTPSAPRTHTKETHLPDTSESEPEPGSESRARNSRTNSGKAGPPRMGSVLDQGWVDQIPELQEARSRRIAPLPPADTQYGVFKGLKGDADLAAGKQVLWFRRQLASPFPVTGNSEAELLLTLAAARAALAVPREELTKGRLAIFASTVGRGLYLKVLGHVRAARDSLDGLLELWPECLQHPDGAGPKIAIGEEART